MSFINSSGLDELARRLAESVPESVRAFGRDMEGNFKAVLQAQLSKLDLVNRQEFDVQAAILERTQAKLAAMEARLKEIAKFFLPRNGAICEAFWGLGFRRMSSCRRVSDSPASPCRQTLCWGLDGMHPSI